MTQQKIVLNFRHPAVKTGVGELPRQQKEKLLVEIPREDLLAVSYEGFRHYKPVAKSMIGIPGVEPKATDHLIMIEYRLPGGDSAKVLLRVHKDDYQNILDALQAILPEPPSRTQLG